MNSHLYLNLARIESFGLTFIESLASKTPIISLGTTGINKTLKDSNIGFFVKNTDEIVKILKKIQSNSSLLYHKRDRALQSVKQFNLEKNIRKINLLYKNFKNY